MTGTATRPYGYDKDSNRTQVGANIYTYDSRDELTSDGSQYLRLYRERGSVLEDTDTGTTPYTNDAYGQQITSGTSTGTFRSYTWDALDRVVSDAVARRGRASPH